MALVSPGTSITVTDQSITAGSAPGTVPLIFIATSENKSDPSGLALAEGTLKVNAGKIYSITSQRDLVQTFGDPTFYSVSGTALNGYPLNEYGLLTAYSYLGISSLTRVVRADIDMTQLISTSVEPTSPALAGTYWLDESASSYGLFHKESSTWVHKTPAFVYNFLTGTANTPDINDGVNGDYAVVFQTESGLLSYWLMAGDVWGVLTGSTGASSIVIQPVWPDATLTNPLHWVKTGSAAQGLNLVLRKMNTSGIFAIVEAPVLADDTAADVYYASLAAKSTGQVYIKISTNKLGFRTCSAMTGSVGTWAAMTTIIGSSGVPVRAALNEQYWFDAEVGINAAGLSTIDILAADGAGKWQNINLPGFTGADYTTYVSTIPGWAPTLYAQSSDPRDDVVPVTPVAGDVWVDTDLAPYPSIKRWDGNTWVLSSNTDQTTPNGVLFADARPAPTLGYAGVNNGAGSLTPDLDADVPDADLYPKGFLLWNTRYSTNVVKQLVSPYLVDGVEVATFGACNTGRWVTMSGNSPTGKPYMGAAAQNIMVVRAIQAAIASNEEIRTEDMYFNLIAAPGYPEAIDEMTALNDDRKQTAFVVGDSPFTLNSSGTSLQAWATNSNLAESNGADGLISASKYVAVWYPSGLSTNVDGTDVVVPPSHMALRSIAYNDQVAYPWFAPAGLQRGVVNNATSVGYVNTSGQFVPVKLSEGQRDILYVNRVNPIRVMPSGGVVLFGQKTRQDYSSATDRINVVRLENHLRYKLNSLAQPFLFEQNDTNTRRSAKDAFDRVLAELVTLRALYDFLVVCDLSNNTPARIDRNEMWIDVAIQPVKTIEYIYIPIRIKNTGSSLTTQ